MVLLLFVNPLIFSTRLWLLELHVPFLSVSPGQRQKSWNPASTAYADMPDAGLSALHMPISLSRHLGELGAIISIIRFTSEET